MRGILPAEAGGISRSREAGDPPGLPRAGACRAARAGGADGCFGVVSSKDLVFHHPSEGLVARKRKNPLSCATENIVIYKPPMCSWSRTVCPSRWGLKSIRQECQIDGKKL